jgi:hypothetical protein
MRIFDVISLLVVSGIGVSFFYAFGMGLIPTIIIGVILFTFSICILNYLNHGTIVPKRMRPPA